MNISRDYPEFRIILLEFEKPSAVSDFTYDIGEFLRAVI